MDADTDRLVAAAYVGWDDLIECPGFYAFGYQHVTDHSGAFHIFEFRYNHIGGVLHPGIKQIIVFCIRILRSILHIGIPIEAGTRDA